MPNSVYSTIISILPSISSILFDLLRIAIKESDFCGTRSDQLIRNDSNSSGSNSDPLK